MEEKRKYPVFRNPDKYMRNRERGNPLGLIKIGGEYRALDRCLKDVPGIHTVCDAPSGPGRMFPYWKKKDYKVYAVDISERMVAASRKAHEAAGIPGKVEMGDIFSLNKILEEKPDLVACIRFAYYFNAEDRARLLRVLADASRRYVLIQYKTTETIKGQINLSHRMSEEKKPKKTHLEQRAVSYDDIIKELKEGGLNPLRIEPIGEFSDRVYVLAEKSETGGSRVAASKNSGVILKKPRRLYLASALLIIFALVYFLNSGRSFFREKEAFLSLGARSVLKGDWLAPRIYDNIFTGNHTLMVWWIAAVSAPFSEVTERSARFAGILLMLGVLYSIYFFARLHGSLARGILTILILGTCYIFWENAVGVGTDMMLTLSLTVVLCAMFTLLNDSFKWKYWWLLWGGLSVAIFLTGPFALVLTGVLFTIYAFSSWKPGEIWKRFLQIRPFAGLLLCLAPFLLWIASVYFSYGIGPVKQIFYNWHIITFSNYIERPENSPHYFLSEFPMNLLPLTPLAAFLLSGFLWKRLKADVPFDPDYRRQERMLIGRLLGMPSGRIYLGLAVFLIAGTALYNGVVARYREGYDSPRSAAREIDRNASANERLILIDNTDPGIIFYITKEFEISDDSDAAMKNLQKMLASDQRMVLVVDGNDLFKFHKLRNPGIYIEATIHFQDKVYYILTNEFRPGAVPLSSLSFRRPA